jgi:hypothetical protein
MGAVPDELTPQGVAQITNPAELLDLAWACEPPLRLNERYAALDRLAGAPSGSQAAA